MKQLLLVACYFWEKERENVKQPSSKWLSWCYDETVDYSADNVELKLARCGNLCDCTPIQDNCKILKMTGGKEFYIHCLQVEICPVHSFDAVRENMCYRFVVITLPHVFGT